MNNATGKYVSRKWLTDSQSVVTITDAKKDKKKERNTHTQPTAWSTKSLPTDSMAEIIDKLCLNCWGNCGIAFSKSNCTDQLLSVPKE